MSKDINDLADSVIDYFNLNEIDITPLILQKILYYIQAWHLVFFDEDPLFEEAPEAWVNGPVYRVIYNRFKDSWSKGETLTLTEPDNLEIHFQETLQKLDLSEDQKEYLFAVLQKYGSLSAGELIYLTHAEDPWNEAREGFGPLELCTNKISHESMYKYYNSRRKSHA